MLEFIQKLLIWSFVFWFKDVKQLKIMGRGFFDIDAYLIMIEIDNGINGRLCPLVIQVEEVHLLWLALKDHGEPLGII